MAGEGQLLQAAREEKQWSYPYTEEITKIRIRYIKALEEEKYEILPGTTYVKGYLRTYAKLLGLNPNEIISLYNATAKNDPISILAVPNALVKVRPFWLRPAIIGSIAILAIVLIVVVKALSQGGTKTVDPPYEPAALPSAPQTENTTPAPVTPVVPDPSDVVATTQDGLTMQLVFTQACWVVVRVDGQPSLEGTFAAGTTKEVKGTNKIELVTIGNAGGLSVTLNGKTLPSLGKAGEVVSNVVLTQEYWEQL